MVSFATGPLSHQFLATLRPCIRVLGSGSLQKDELGVVESCAWFGGYPSLSRGFPGGSRVDNLPVMWETLGWEYPLEKETAITPPWEISWTGKPGMLHSMGLQRVRHD